MIKIGSKLFMITSLFCLRQHTFPPWHWFLFKNLAIPASSVTTELFIVAEFITTCLKATELFFQNIKNYGVILQFIFCWRKHIFLMIIQIFTEKHFSSNFWTANPQNMSDPHFLAFWEIYILITHCWPTKNVKWNWMGLNDVTWLIFPEIDEKTADVSKNIS